MLRALALLPHEAIPRRQYRRYYSMEVLRLSRPVVKGVNKKGRNRLPALLQGRGVLFFMQYAGDRTMKRVAVIHQDGRVLGTYNIDFANLNRELIDHWYFEKARENAIADKLVDSDEAKQLSFRFVQ